MESNWTLSLNNAAGHPFAGDVAALLHDAPARPCGNALGLPPAAIVFRGGLAAWQQRVVAEHIERHLAGKIVLSELARLVRLSPYHFARAFKQSFGQPPHRYQLLRRVERAKAHLSGSAMPVTEIALALGFSDTSAFTATFHKLAGVTPTAWRRLYREPACDTSLAA